MNVLLVYPEYPNTFWSFNSVLKFISKKAMYPPLGLLTVASMLPKEWKKGLIDVNVRKLKDSHIEWADIVFISGMLVQKKNAHEIISRCKSKGKTVVVGGPLFTTGHEQFNDIDHFVLNEAEVTLPLFLKDFKEGKAKKVYTSSERPDITKTPVPMWKLINLKDYASMAVQYSRGCPFNCEFCDIIIMNGRVPRTKTPEQMESEMQALFDAGWEGTVFVVDDNFIGNKANVKKMLAKIIKWQEERKYPFSFLTEASVNLAQDEELMNMMSRANFASVFVGIETPNLESLRECSKYQNTALDLEESVKKIHQHGMQVLGGFIVGFDSDDAGIFDAQIEFIKKVGIVTAMVGLLNALPRTRLWHRLKNEGRIVKEPTGENTDATTNFIPKMGSKALIKGYKKILANIYSPKEYYRRIDIFLKHYRPTAREKFSKERVNAFLKSTWKIGLLSRSRFLYWKLLLKTFFTNNKAFPTAVSLAIYGMHFQQITQQVLGSAL
ncbi:DUF4070 domain-containing protein [Candidatus Woesearchaeota archaeon]|nr:DUF4070 domain-containing protein [Candidatus Woesearchaeota archaeon]